VFAACCAASGGELTDVISSYADAALTPDAKIGESKAPKVDLHKADLKSLLEALVSADSSLKSAQLDVLPDIAASQITVPELPALGTIAIVQALCSRVGAVAKYDSPGKRLVVRRMVDAWGPMETVSAELIKECDKRAANE